jgi:NAD(P)H dehydrogenase (quinone)
MASRLRSEAEEEHLRVYVLFAHPTLDSFCHATLKSFVRGLHESGHQMEIGDLYRMPFLPTLDETSFMRERVHPVEAAVPADVAGEQARIRRSDALALVFPLWWSDVPAILKGWFDRVWTRGFARSPTGETELRRLAPRKALALCTSVHPVDKLERDGVMAGLHAILLGDRLTNVSYRRAELVVLGGLTTADEGQRRALLDEAYRHGRKF